MMIKRAFTLIELIMVIVIMGILAVFGANIYLNIYKNYIFARSVDELESKTQLVLDQISSRLTQRIHLATIGRAGLDSTDIVGVDSSSPRYTVLEWIGQSDVSKRVGSFSGANSDILGWSGFANLEESNATFLSTPGSNLQEARITINSTSNNGVNNLLVVFLGGDFETDYRGFGFDGTFNKVVSADLLASTDQNMSIDINDMDSTRLTERYYLAHSAYAIVPSVPTVYNYKINGNNKTFSDFNLTLYYDYQPWVGQSMTDGRSEVLASNVTLFRFRGNNGSIDLKICMRDSNIPDSDFVVCKAKVVQ